MTPEQAEQLKPLIKFAGERTQVAEKAAEQQFEMSAAANADVRRMSLLGSAGAIGLLSTRVPASADHLTMSYGTAVVAMTFFAAAVGFAVSGRLKEWTERATYGLELQKRALTIYRQYTSSEATQHYLSTGELPVEASRPTGLTSDSDRAFSLAYGLMFGGGVTSALHLLAPLLSPVLTDVWCQLVDAFAG